jgi:hypothetical protein
MTFKLNFYVLPTEAYKSWPSRFFFFDSTVFLESSIVTDMLVFTHETVTVTCVQLDIEHRSDIP